MAAAEGILLDDDESSLTIRFVRFVFSCEGTETELTWCRVWTNEGRRDGPVLVSTVDRVVDGTDVIFSVVLIVDH